MENLKEWLRYTEEFENAFTDAKEFVREEINPFIDTLELSKDTQCDYCFPLVKPYILGLDKDKLTLWIFSDEERYTASVEEQEAKAEEKKAKDIQQLEKISRRIKELREEKDEILDKYKRSLCDKESCINCDDECPYELPEGFEQYRYI